MDKFFNKAKTYCSDCYVVDYTNETNSKRGVEIHTEQPEDIAYFHVKDPKKIEYWGINFEEHPAFFKGVSQCECMFASKKFNKKGWACLVELKYCLEKNVESNSGAAFAQLNNTLDFLKGKGVLDSDNYRIYLNISIPDHSNKEPFLSFISTQDDVLDKLKNERVQVLGYNQVLILNEGFIKVPKQEI